MPAIWIKLCAYTLVTSAVVTVTLLAALPDNTASTMGITSTILYVISQLAPVIVCLYVLNRHVLKPLGTLANMTRQLARGEYLVEPTTFPTGELANMAGSLRTLADNLQRNIQSQGQENMELNDMLIKLLNSEQRANSIFNNVQDGLVVTDGLGIIEAVNPALCDMTGYRADELLGQSVEILIPKTYRPKHQQKIVNFTLDNNTSKRGYLPLQALHKNGEIIPVEISMSKSSTNNQHHLIAVVHDISARLKIEHDLRHERDRAQSYLDTAEVAIISIDTEGLITLVNHKCCELLGYNESELLGMDYFKLCPDQDVAMEIREAYIQHITSNELFPKYFYINLRAKDGQIKIFEWHNNTIRDYEWNTTGIILAGTDMTQFRKSLDERRALRERLQQSQKMQAIGQLSGAIAHDFNNLLASMMGYTELLQDMLSDTDDESIQTYLKEIYTSGERARDLVENILKYSRNKRDMATGHSDMLYISTISPDLLTLLQGILPAHIRLTINFEQNAYPVLIDTINLQQIIVNLCLNASEAMRDGGDLIISTHNTDNVNKVCASCGKAITGNFMALTVTDTGRGIETRAINQLFDPFYTTKQVAVVGKGAGMGLAVVHGLVHDALGHIMVESKPKIGSTFSIMLPAAMEPPVSNSAQG